MGKLYLFYSKHNSSQLGDILKVKIDDQIIFEVKENEFYEQELTDSQHNIKMYYEGWTSDQLVGYIDQTIDVVGDTYYMYKPPMTLSGKGKLICKKYNTSDDFKKYVKNSNKLHKIWVVILIILAFLVLLFL